jgi:GNAT superfamily N-acetyltransferase
MTGGGEDLRRTIAFERWLGEVTADRVVPTAHGHACTHPGFPRRYDSNYLWIEDPAPGLEAATLDAEVAEALPSFEHREITVNEDAAGSRMAPGFADLGYEATRLVVMAARRDADLEPAVPVADVSFEGGRPLFEEGMRREPSVDGEELMHSLVGWRRRLEDVVGARFFVGRVDGADAGACELYRHEGVAMIEDVFTLEEFRGRGVARAVVLAAVSAARAGGDDLVFLHAVSDSWPRTLYTKLGFDPIGHVWSFLRSPVPAER